MLEKLGEVLRFLRDPNPPENVLQLTGPAYNRAAGAIDADLSDEGYALLIPHNAIVIVEGQYVLAKTKPGLFDIRVFFDAADAEKTVAMAVARERGKDAIARQDSRELRQRMRQIDIPSAGGFNCTNGSNG